MILTLLEILLNLVLINERDRMKSAKIPETTVTQFVWDVEELTFLKKYFTQILFKGKYKSCDL